VDFKTVLRNHLRDRKPPFLFIFTWMLGMSSVIDRVQLKSLQNQAYPLDNWPAMWGFILVGGIVSGYIACYVGGAFYQLRVSLAGGSKSMHISRNLFLYTGIPIYAITILSATSDTFVYGDKYFTGKTNPSLDVTWFFLAVGAILYSIALSYRGVRLLLDTKHIRSIIMFIALPVLFYSLVFGAVYAVQEFEPQAVDYNEQGLALMYEGNYDEAERLFKLAIEKLDSDDRNNALIIYGNLGLMHKFAGNTEEAIENYQKALSFCEPSDSEYYSTSGRINILTGDIEKAVRNFEKSLELDPDDFDAHNSLGLIFLGEYDEDMTDYERALAHNERSYALNEGAATAENLAINYFAVGKFDDALPLFESVDAAHPENALAKYFLGLIHYDNNDLTKAKAYLEDAIALDPSLNSPDIEIILQEQDGPTPVSHDDQP
jgi:tetratricopeptide (TPR) repeat protein